MIDYGQQRPVKGFPGYSVTADGRVYSTNNSRTGEAKPMGGRNKDPLRKVTLCRGAQIRKQRRVADLVMEAWGTLEHFNAANKAKEDDTV